MMAVCFVCPAPCPTPCPSCFVCPAPCPTPCPSCHQVFHCPTHLHVHRPKDKCLPFNIVYSEGKGHYMVATRDIKQLEVILSEPPAALGPYTKTYPQCLQCFKKVSGEFRCSGCNFPMCDSHCAKGSHHNVECQLFQTVDFKAKIENLDSHDSSYSCITPLRLLALKQSSPDMWQRLSRLEDHNDRRRKADEDLWYLHQTAVINFLTQVCKLDFTEAEIHRVIGIMFTNCANLELAESSHGRGCGYYPTYANINHACVSNTKTLKFPDNRLEVRSQVRIKAGEEISTQYLQPMKATFARRPILREKWHFDCYCPRCLDPRECGSYLGALLCQRPRCGGAVLPLDPLCGESLWCCEDCGEEVDVETVVRLVMAADKQVGEPLEEDDIIQHYERFLHHHSGLLHPHNYIIIDVKQKLGCLYGNFVPYLNASLPRPLKDRKIQVCQDVLDVVSKVDPGYTKVRGKMLTEINKTKILTCKLDFEKGFITQKQLQRVLSEKQFLLMYLGFYQSLLFGKSK